jgi:NAD(P)-dependent dehydrogenase (short-subunit alcohol dehydrogenase family)
MIWGGSGGIGTALVRRLADEGWNILSVARDPGAVTYLTTEVVGADVRDLESVQHALQEAEKLVDEVDLWIYAVGDIVSTKIGEMPVDEWERILTANLSGAYLAVRHSLPLLAGDAHIVFLGAVSERLRLPGLAAYAAAKAGLEAFADVLRKEQRKRRVTVVRPQAVETGLWDKVPFGVPKGALEPDEVAERIVQAYTEGQGGTLDV